jgi:prevent-host-death family protein
MKLSNQVKPISKLKAEAPDVIRHVAEARTPVIITVNGEAKAVLQDIASYEEMQESLALLKILALSRKSIEAGKARPLRAAFARIRRRLKA